MFTEEERNDGVSTSGTPRWISLLFAVLFIGGLALGYGLYTSNSEAKKNSAQFSSKLGETNAALDKADAKITDLQSQLGVASKKLGITQSELKNAREDAQKIRKEQQAKAEQLQNDLQAVKSEGDQKVSKVAGDLEATNKDVVTTKGELDKTKAQLATVTGDLGVQSGRIARTADDLVELRRLGERDYAEFTLTKTKAPQRVGPIQLKLQSVNPKKNKYTVTVFADDKTIEKKDKTSGEPVQFYARGSRRAPYEIVVFNVSKDGITGYLSTPKDATERKK